MSRGIYLFSKAGTRTIALPDSLRELRTIASAVLSKAYGSISRLALGPFSFSAKPQPRRGFQRVVGEAAVSQLGPGRGGDHGRDGTATHLEHSRVVRSVSGSKGRRE